MKALRVVTAGVLLALSAAAVPAAAQNTPPAHRMTAPRVSREAGAARREAAVTLVRLLKDQDAAVRTTAYLALSRSRPAEAVPELTRLLNDTDPAAVKSAVDLLAAIQTPEAIQALIRQANEKKGQLRIDIARALAGSPPPTALVREFYGALLRDEDPRLRLAATAGLGNMLLGPGTPPMFRLPASFDQSAGTGMGGSGYGGSYGGGHPGNTRGTTVILPGGGDQPGSVDQPGARKF